MLRPAGLVIWLSLLPAVVASQSLGEIARKEKERRQRNREKDVKVRVIEERELTVSSPAQAVPSEEGLGDGAEASLEAVDTQENSLSSSGSDRQRQEAEWRSRFSEARQRLDAASKRYETLSQLHLSPGEYYTDENGRPLITSLDQLRRLVAEAQAELDRATRAMDELREEARRAGVPPGWMR